MLRIGFGSRVLFLHVKLKVCDPKAPRDCSSPLLAPPPCTFLTCAFSVERAQLTCWCSAVRRRSQSSSFGASCLLCSDSAPSSAPSAGCQSSCRPSSTSCSSGSCSWCSYPSGRGCCIGRRPTLACQLAGRPAPVLGRARTRRSRPRTALAALARRHRPISVCLARLRGDFGCRWRRHRGDGMRPGGEGNVAGVC